MPDTSIIQSLYARLKQDIREHKLPVGVALKQETLAGQYGVSRIPVRDVLQQLKREGWLTQCGKRGVMVQPLSIEEVQDLSLMREYLEPLILEYALPNLTNQRLGMAEDIMVLLDSPHLSVAEYGELNWQFHASLYQPAQRPTLFTVIENLHQLCSRYIGYHAIELKYTSTSQEEHRQLLAAIKKCDTLKAQHLLKSHIAKASKQLVDYLDKVKEV
ncbi:GntR family transcriptional regulator [Paraglaciecola sp.]|uniref:GntR family transcriptional regulator n=1 Tax=Paraglaciecola sp. TaxID=1920173 RepID=UPI002740055B|nr:GntR family transcriptional regulator [Paraglaciecola sp.]MDP5031349.1 GntR family transcriptional regulator [Paraglaciecola sp.]